MPSDVSAFEVTERLRGGATTEFGAPGGIPEADARALDAAELGSQLLILDAAWKALDAAAKSARGKELRKGPRGGGRDLPKILEHVVGAETSYLASLGARHRGSAEEHGELRKAVRAALTAVARGEPIENANAVKKRWPPRYFMRRAVWHVIDHAWEIEDRAT